MTAIDWIRDNYESPREIFVAGSSAGGLGMSFYASLLARQYPSARVVGLGDDAGSYGLTVTSGADPGQWGIPDVLRRHPGWEKFHDSLGVEHLYITASRSTPNLRLYQFDHADDHAQRFFMELAGAEDPDVLRHLRANRQIIREQVPEFRSFIMGGFAHEVMTYETFYHYQADGHRLSDWVTAIVAGEPVASVDCGDDCLRPGLVYTEDDLRIVERAIDLLSAPDAWNSEDAPGPCPSDADHYSIRCAVMQAAIEVTGQAPTDTGKIQPSAYDILQTVKYRLDHRGPGDVFRWFNNDEDATAADMIDLLEEVRGRIHTSLAAKQ